MAARLAHARRFEVAKQATGLLFAPALRGAGSGARPHDAARKHARTRASFETTRLRRLVTPASPLKLEAGPLCNTAYENRSPDHTRTGGFPGLERRLAAQQEPCDGSGGDCPGAQTANYLTKKKVSGRVPRVPAQRRSAHGVP